MSANDKFGADALLLRTTKDFAELADQQRAEHARRDLKEKADDNPGLKEAIGEVHEAIGAPEVLLRESMMKGKKPDSSRPPPSLGISPKARSIADAIVGPLPSDLRTSETISRTPAFQKQDTIAKAPLILPKASYRAWWIGLAIALLGVAALVWFTRDTTLPPDPTPLADGSVSIPAEAAAPRITATVAPAPTDVASAYVPPPTTNQVKTNKVDSTAPTTSTVSTSTPAPTLTAAPTSTWGVF